MEIISPCKLIFCILIVVDVLVVIQGQQPYVNNKQLACDDSSNNNITRGFVCNRVGSSCQSYLTFRSNPPYNSAVSIAYLLSAQPDSIVSINQLASATATIPTNDQVIIPVNCSCSGSTQSSYYQHNATYKIITTGETYFSVSNNTYQGLTTCQAMMAQNTYGEKNITEGNNLTVPIRCACPSTNQTASGVKYLLNFLITWGDSISAIAETFKVDEKSILDANELSSGQNIYPFTTILVPLKTEPTKIESPVASPPPAPSPQTPSNPPDESSKKWVFVGVGIGVGLLLLIALLAFLFCFFRRKSKKPKSKPVSGSGPKMVSETTDYTSLPENSKSWSTSVSTQGFRSAVESLTIYKFQDLATATGNFSEENRIKGSVYKGSFKGDDAAVKMMKGDVSSEINILKKINHSNIIRLSGFCVHQGNTYLVYESADNGSLDDWLHSKYQTASATLDWKKRVQIAYDVANALNYLHKYTNPPYIHKNLKSSNILLDTNFRAKIANFGLARSVDDEEQGGMQLTRHVVGTHGYMAPEYIENGVITSKLDVFAFGVVILELLSGREALTGDKNRDKNSGEEMLSVSINKVLEGDNVREKLRGFMDPSLRNEYPLDLAFSVAQLAKNCVAHDLNARPSMVEVFINLSKILSSLSDWDPSDELDRSKSVGSGR
ncbi:protein LYK5-like isoform X4 [Pistacia vera]|uniref:protein LYK5-like isoform X4 n=1 Tax=Pistacia vera TaxID=55513 RepID=UPI001262B7CC|nr:protein LYK5-like isoform X4 [Pistacia vera]